MEEVSEIYVSQERAKDNEELYYYIIHGLLHIIGYDHRNKKEELLMGNKCCEYLNNPKEKN
jgi:rRNA maturation RNase YbeY